MNQPTATQAAILRALAEPGAYLDFRGLCVYVNRGGAWSHIEMTPDDFDTLLGRGWVTNVKSWFWQLTAEGVDALLAPEGERE